MITHHYFLIRKNKKSYGVGIDMKNGYIKLDRALNNWRYKHKPNYVALWVHLLVNASYLDNVYEGILVKRGQLLTSYSSLVKGTGIPLQKIRTIFNNLKNEEITIKATNKYTIITIINYDFYQSNGGKTTKKTVQEKSKNQQATNKQLTTIKNNNNNKRIDDDIKNIKIKYLEAGYSISLIDMCFSLMNKFNLKGEKNFNKVLDVLENENIIEKQGYLYTMLERNDLS